jgi:hypothetical protein
MNKAYFFSKYSFIDCRHVIAYRIHGNYIEIYFHHKDEPINLFGDTVGDFISFYLDYLEKEEE